MNRNARFVPGGILRLVVAALLVGLIVANCGPGRGGRVDDYGGPYDHTGPQGSGSKDK